VGADITAGVLSSGMDDTTRVTLFMDVGTNGEIVLGSREWLVTCAFLRPGFRRSRRTARHARNAPAPSKKCG